MIIKDKHGERFESTVTADSPDDAREQSEQTAREAGWEPEVGEMAEITPAAPGQFHVHFRVVRIERD
jgi:hypothetical protein